MNAIKQFLLTLLISIFITPTLYAQPCIGDNCLASIGNSKSISNKASFAVSPQEDMELDMIPLDDNIGMIELTDNTVDYSDNQIDNASLDDNIEFYTDFDEEIEYTTEEAIDSEIVLIDESMGNIDNSILIATADIITYACDFVGANTLLCDDVTKECQCV